MADKRFEYEVALSSAGEDRKPAEALARILKHLSVPVFYDEFEKDALWGKDLFQHLADIYKNKARYCIVFVSKYYRSKKWTKHEFQNAQARLFTEQSEYILPIWTDVVDKSSFGWNLDQAISLPASIAGAVLPGLIVASVLLWTQRTVRT